MSVLSRLNDILRAQLGSLRPLPREQDEQQRKVQRAKQEETSVEPPAPTNDPQLVSLYANLELPYGAPVADIRTARKRLIKRYHPDRYGSDPHKQAVATELIKGINHAHDTLITHLEKEQI